MGGAVLDYVSRDLVCNDACAVAHLHRIGRTARAGDLVMLLDLARIRISAATAAGGTGMCWC